MALWDDEENEYWPHNWQSGNASIGNSPASGGGFYGGLLDFFNDPKKMAGLSSLGAALTQAGAPSATRNNWSSALSSALSAYQNGQIGYDQTQHRNKMQALQEADLREQAQLRQAQAAAAKAEAERVQRLRDIANGVDQNYFTQGRY